MTRRLKSSLLLLLFVVGLLAPVGAAAQTAVGQAPESPRLLALKSALESGRGGDALGEFWREVEREGAPLVEPLKGDEESHGGSQHVSSIVELPGAPPQPFVAERTGVKKGRVELIRYGGDTSEGGRRVWVYTPPGYRPAGRPYRLLLLFDGWQYTHTIPVPTILDNMIADGALPPTVAVMIDKKERMKELYLNPSFADFVAGPFIKWVRERYNVTHSPRESVVGGLSLGGVAAAYTALRHPEVFGGVLSQSGAFQYRHEDPEGLMRRFTKRARVAVRFYLEAGLLEVNETPSLLHTNRHLRDVLEAKGYAVTYSEFNGRHDAVCWRGSLSQGLAALLARR